MSSGRKCPECSSDNYLFRGRKKIEASPEKGIEASTETKYACQACGHMWKERVKAA